MPCYRCGALQTDPDRGRPSPWKRGVRADAQVLVCPDCQRGRDWTAELDHCPACRSTLLVRVLGETVCRACGQHHVAADASAPAGAAPTPLADEVARAVERVLRRDGSVDRRGS